MSDEVRKKGGATAITVITISTHAAKAETLAAWVEMVFILNAEWEIVIAGLAVIIAGLAITISCHEPNFTVDSDEMGLDSDGIDLGTDEMRWGLGKMGMVADEMAVDSGMTTAGMGILPADSGILPAGAFLVGVMGDGMGMGAASGAIVRVATAQIIAAAGCNCL